MDAGSANQASLSGKGGLIAAIILGAVLLIAAIWSLARVLGNASPHGAVALTNVVVVPDAVLPPDAIEMQGMVEQQATPVILTSIAVPPAVIPTKQQEKAVALQKAKTRVNQLIVERMKQSIKDNPGRDNRILEKQIEKREKQCVPMP